MSDTPEHLSPLRETALRQEMGDALMPTIEECAEQNGLSPQQAAQIAIAGLAERAGLAVAVEGQAKFLTPGEAGRLLGVSPKTVDRWADDGQIPCIVTLGGHRRFRAEDILDVLEAYYRPAQGHEA